MWVRTPPRLPLFQLQWKVPWKPQIGFEHRGGLWLGERYLYLPPMVETSRLLAAGTRLEHERAFTAPTVRTRLLPPIPPVAMAYGLPRILLRCSSFGVVSSILAATANMTREDLEQLIGEPPKYDSTRARRLPYYGGLKTAYPHHWLLSGPAEAIELEQKSANLIGPLSISCTFSLRQALVISSRSTRSEA